MDCFDALVTEPKLRTTTRTLFKNEHYVEAVKKAFILLDNAVQERSGLTDLTGDQLMRGAFSPKNPRLRLNGLQSRSDGDEQQGYMEIYAGVMKGIRNPRSHEVTIDDDVETAIELLTLANHLLRTLGGTTKTYD